MDFKFLLHAANSTYNLISFSANFHKNNSRKALLEKKGNQQLHGRSKVSKYWTHPLVNTTRPLQCIVGAVELKLNEPSFLPNVIRGFLTIFSNC